ncbi:MAG: TonB family protein [Chitinispirillales bacterium]|jgi:TonB family protein|nr:TonB family protein [Chitinispirillales bacterium]
MNFFTRRVRTLALAAAVAAVCLSGCGGGGGSGGRSAELAGHWVHKDGKINNRPDDVELFKDGTGVLDGTPITWKVESKRLALLSTTKGMTCDYKIAGLRLTLFDKSGDSALYLKKEYADVLAKAKAYDDKKEYDNAIAEYTKAIQMDPGSADAYLGRGRNHNAKNDHGKAIADYTKAIQLNPNSALGYTHRGAVYWLDTEEPDKAIADFTKVINIDHKDRTGYIGRGGVYSELKKEYDSAIADYTEAIRLYPREGLWYVSRGNAYLEKKDYDNAIADLTKAIQLEPNVAKLLDAKDNLQKAKRLRGDDIAAESEPGYKTPSAAGSGQSNFASEVDAAVSGGSLKPKALKVSSPDFLKSGAITGARSRASIQRTVMQNMAALRYAYNKRLREKPGMAGKIAVKFAIDEFGKVISAQLVESTVSDSEFESTVVSRVKSWNFEKIDKPGDVTEVMYPFVFSQ